MRSNFIQRLPKWLWIEHFTIDYYHYCYYLGNVGYRFLDSLAKWVMTALTIATVLAVVVALFKHREYAPNFEAPTPWRMAALPFIVSLMGWMPCPIEISAINSM
ncbi:MAG: hypothetical protein Q4Q00_13020, partial [Turicibacter sp.]|nr:hypothetical protein [Turicibacter sp.]